MAEPFERPALTSSDEKYIEQFAHRLLGQLDRGVFRLALLTLLAENMKLTKEVNQHREKLGYECLPVHKPEI